MSIKNFLDKLEPNQNSFRLSRKNSGGGGPVRLNNTRSRSPQQDVIENIGESKDGKSIFLVDAKQLQFEKPVVGSVINIYNPKKVNMAGTGKGSADFTSEAEKKEIELEQRRKRREEKRKRRMALLTGGSVAGAATGDDDEDDDDGGGGGLLKTIERGIKGIAGASVVRSAISRVRGGPSVSKTPTKPSTPKTTKPTPPRAGTRKPGTAGFDKQGRFRGADGRFAKAPNPTAATKSSRFAKVGKNVLRAGAMSARGAGMLTRLAGGPVGVLLIGAELAANEYLRRLQESTGAQDVANASHAVREGNTFYTNDRSEVLGEFPDDAPDYVRSIITDRANLLQNTRTIVGSVRAAKDAFLANDDSTGSMYLKSIENLKEERARIAGRIGGIMAAEGLISNANEASSLGKLSPGSLGGISFEGSEGNLDLAMQQELSKIKKSFSFFEFMDKSTVDQAMTSLNTTDLELLSQTASRRRRNYEASRPASELSTPSSSAEFPNTPTENNMIQGGASIDGTPINLNLNNAPNFVSMPQTSAPLITREDDSREIRDLVIGNGQNTGSSGLD